MFKILQNQNRLFSNLLIFIVFFFHLSVSAQNNFDKIDRHALAADSLIAQSLKNLCNYLVEPAANDLEKVRSFYIWITHNIGYDTKAYFSNSQKKYTPEEVLKRKKAVCEGYATLLKAMCDMENIPCEIISGYSKGYGYKPNKTLKSKDHAWNAVKINEKWYLIDATWGSGYLDDKGHFKKYFSNYFFLTSPETFIYEHLPADPMWQLLKTPITLKEYKTDSSQIKKFLKEKDGNFNYNDSINAYEKLPDYEQKIKTAFNQYKFNNKLASPVGFAYMDRAFTLFNNLMEDKNIPTKDAYQKQLYILQLYEKALYYFNLGKDEASLQAKKVCKANINSCKQNLKSYEQMLNRN
ncbi:MAG: hypothetical protein GXO79_03485 [Chlorobi bacterium]|nr:hypothetical protein [Chlorobiota bacterium]